MTQAQQRIQEVKRYFKNGDVDIGYRRLLDCVMDTQDMEFYNRAIDLTEWKESHPEALDQFQEKANQLLDQLANIPVQEAKRETIIAVNELEKSYGYNRFCLGPISLELKKGEVYGLVGENGNGKTTLLRALAKELKPTKGEAYYLFDEKEQGDFDLRTKLVYIPQRTPVWYGSLKDNLKFVLSNYGVPPEENETRILMMIARFGLWNYKHLKWKELSSGYKMRFELARTLLRQPELLLLDEPLANLDILSQQLILEDLKSICNSINNPIALLLSSQQLYEVEKVSDKVIYLEKGKHIAQDAGATDESVPEDKSLIVEIEGEIEREALQRILSHLPLERLLFNGGVYIAYFSSETQYHQVLYVLGKHEATITYSRNISESSRRFFVS
ncbi:ABC transporter ATP-binding protein [Aureisphaera galaxeae]|uniref:ABC transporter ATP-binding protein n=1 Tax=Aureisphaera galaxeae TaxID=1538023 RepID=UPI002350F9C7|nr:ABC transporter ATP-binding protein [Aureisphaera galaxeae]MDC8003630.1 ABC transporter ATP-binding protein [Aureisphaera galaxeae]